MSKVPKHIKVEPPGGAVPIREILLARRIREERDEQPKVSPVVRMPIPPSNNNYKRHYCTESVTWPPERRDIHKVKARLTERAKEFRHEAGWAARRAHVEMVPMPREVVVEIDVFQIETAQVDVDNIPKMVFDALEGIAFEDDQQVVEFTVRRHRVYEAAENHIEVQIKERVDGA